MSSFWGTGGPKIELLNNLEDSIIKTYNFDTPDKSPDRIAWQRENDDVINPLTRDLVEREFGHRLTIRLYYSGAQISGTVEDLVEIINTNLQIKVMPYSDVLALNALCKITDYQIGHKDGYHIADSIMVEFTSIKLFKNVFNIDTYYTVSPRRSIYVAP